MKWIVFTLVALLFLGLIAFAVMAMQSQKAPDKLGLNQGLLRACPESPNCVCSEAHSRHSEQHAISPIKISEKGWAEMKKSITEQGGVIEQEDSDYLHATFTTPLFRFVDDVELRLDEASGLIHIRSASRVGRSDFGVNRKRVNQLKQ